MLVAAVARCNMYVQVSGFVDNVMFVHNGQVYAVNRTYAQSDSLGDRALGAKSDIYSWLVTDATIGESGCKRRGQLISTRRG